MVILANRSNLIFSAPRLATAGGSAGLFQDDSFGGEADFGEAQEDEAEDGRGVLLGLEAGVRAELVGGVPKALFECRRGDVFFRRCDPVHGLEFRDGDCFPKAEFPSNKNATANGLIRIKLNSPNSPELFA
jgi:hypothetical protein